MQIENHKEEVPFAHYEEKFRELAPEDVIARLSAVKWDGAAFTVKLLGREFVIAHPDYAITAVDGGALPHCPPRLSCSATCWRERTLLGTGSG